jgi:hypothetical protein
MFRESDYQYPVLHPTYTNKEKVQLQITAANSHLEQPRHCPRDRCVATVNDAKPMVVPTTHDVAYDPRHPEADWAGLVSVKRAQKKHTSGDHPCQRGHLVQDERGIIGDDSDRYPAAKKDITPESYRAAQLEGPMIGGIDVQDHYKTTYQQVRFRFAM